MSERQEPHGAGARKVRISLTSKDGQVLEAPHITDLAGVPRQLLNVVSAPEFVHVSWTFKCDEKTLIYDIQRMVEHQINLFQQQPQDKMITATEVSGLFVLFTLNCGHTGGNVATEPKRTLSFLPVLLSSTSFPNSLLMVIS